MDLDTRIKRCVPGKLAKLLKVTAAFIILTLLGYLALCAYAANRRNAALDRWKDSGIDLVSFAAALKKTESNEPAKRCCKLANEIGIPLKLEDHDYNSSDKDTQPYELEMYVFGEMRKNSAKVADPPQAAIEYFDQEKEPLEKIKDLLLNEQVIFINDSDPLHFGTYSALSEISDLSHTLLGYSLYLHKLGKDETAFLYVAASMNLSRSLSQSSHLVTLMYAGIIRANSFCVLNKLDGIDHACLERLPDFDHNMNLDASILDNSVEMYFQPEQMSFEVWDIFGRMEDKVLGKDHALRRKVEYFFAAPFKRQLLKLEAARYLESTIPLLLEIKKKGVCAENREIESLERSSGEYGAFVARLGLCAKHHYLQQKLAEEVVSLKEIRRKQGRLPAELPHKITSCAKDTYWDLTVYDDNTFSLKYSGAKFGPKVYKKPLSLSYDENVE